MLENLLEPIEDRIKRDIIVHVNKAIYNLRGEPFIKFENERFDEHYVKPIEDKHFHVWIHFTPIKNDAPKYPASSLLYDQRWSNECLSFNPFKSEPDIILKDENENAIGEFVTLNNFFIYHQLRYLKHITSPDFKVFKRTMESLAIICEETAPA